MSKNIFGFAVFFFFWGWKKHDIEKMSMLDPVKGYAISPLFLVQGSTLRLFFLSSRASGKNKKCNSTRPGWNELGRLDEHVSSTSKV